MPPQFLTVYVDNYAAIRASPLVGSESEAETCALLARAALAQHDVTGSYSQFQAKIDGLAEALGREGVCSNYSPDHVRYTWECIKAPSPEARRYSLSRR